MKLNGLEKYFETDKNGEIVDFKQVSKNGQTPLIYALISNKSQNLNLNKEQWDYLIENSDLKQMAHNDWSPLMLTFIYNKKENLNLISTQFDYLIENSDLKQVNKNGDSPLMHTLTHNKSQNLNLSSEQFNYLIKNSDLKKINNNGVSPLIYALHNNKSQNLNLNSEQWDYLIYNSNIKSTNIIGHLFSLHNENNLSINIMEENYTYIIENSDLNVYYNKKPLVYCILNDSLFLNRISSKNKNYLISKFPEFLEDTCISSKITTNLELQKKVLTLENKIEELTKIIYTLNENNNVIIEKLNLLNKPTFTKKII